jgi:hypothetical protein
MIQSLNDNHWKALKQGNWKIIAACSVYILKRYPQINPGSSNKTRSHNRSSINMQLVSVTTSAYIKKYLHNKPLNNNSLENITLDHVSPI